MPGERRRYELWGESIREVGVLLLVFVPLDVFLRDEIFTWRKCLIAVGCAIFGLLLVEIGVRIQREE